MRGSDIMPIVTHGVRSRYRVWPGSKRSLESRAGTAQLATLLCLCLAGKLHAQDVQPRTYAPAPVGIDVFTLGYSYSSGQVLFDKTIPIDDATGDIHNINAAYSRSVGLRGMAGRIDIALPFVTGDWEGTATGAARTTSRTGLGDPVVRMAVFFVGAPALTSEQFSGFRPKTVLGSTLRMSLPLGAYDPDNLVNIGSNRWSFSPQVGVSHIAGRLIFDGYVGVWFFTDNGEFLGSDTLSQDPLFTAQVHVGYRFRPGFWIAASSRQSLGGATRRDGGDKLAPEANNRVGLTLARRLGGRYTIKVFASTGLAVAAGNDYTTFAVVWQVTL